MVSSRYDFNYNNYLFKYITKKNLLKFGLMTINKEKKLFMICF